MDQLIKRTSQLGSVLPGAEAKAFSLDAKNGKASTRSDLGKPSGSSIGSSTSKTINNGLQVRRLELIRNIGVLAVFLLVAFAPIL